MFLLIELLFLFAMMCGCTCLSRVGSLDEGSFCTYCPHTLYPWINKYFDFDFDFNFDFSDATDILILRSKAEPLLVTEISADLEKWVFISLHF